MPLSLVLACVWGLVAGLAGMAPQRFHWPAAWILIATGIPLLGYVTLQTGPVWGLICLAAGGPPSCAGRSCVRAQKMKRAIVVRARA